MSRALRADSLSIAVCQHWPDNPFPRAESDYFFERACCILGRQLFPRSRGRNQLVGRRHQRARPSLPRSRLLDKDQSRVDHITRTSRALYRYSCRPSRRPCLTRNANVRKPKAIPHFAHFRPENLLARSSRFGTVNYSLQKRGRIHEYLSFRAAVKTDAGTAAAAHTDGSKVRFASNRAP